MLKLVEGFLDVCRHGDITYALVVVPVNGETAIEGFGPVNGYSIYLLERLDEMVCRVLANVLDTKIVDHKEEAYVFGGMLHKGRGSSNGGVAKIGKVDLEPIVRNAAGLFQAWHSFADLQVHPYVRCELDEVVLGYDLFRKYRQAYFHILVTPHGGVVIKILMSRVMKRAPGVDMVLFKRNLVVVNMAKLVFVSPEKSNLFLPTVTRTRCISVFWGRMLATICE